MTFEMYAQTPGMNRRNRSQGTSPRNIVFTPQHQPNSASVSSTELPSNAFVKLVEHSVYTDNLTPFERSLLHVFDRTHDRKKDFKTTNKQLVRTIRERNMKSLDDTLLDPGMSTEFRMFEVVTEGLMRLVFEEAMENGFFGLLTDMNQRKR